MKLITALFIIFAVTAQESRAQNPLQALPTQPVDSLPAAKKPKVVRASQQPVTPGVHVELPKPEKHVEEKKMFGGVTFMVNGKMCTSVGYDRFMFRIDPELHDKLVEEEGITGVIMGGRSYKGYVHVSEDVVKTDRELEDWVNLALDFNKRAKPSKKKKSETRQKKERMKGTRT